MLTAKQRSNIYIETRLPVNFQSRFDLEWDDAVKQLRNTRANLEKIKITGRDTEYARKINARNLRNGISEKRD